MKGGQLDVSYAEGTISFFYITTKTHTPSTVQLNWPDPFLLSQVCASKFQIFFPTKTFSLFATKTLFQIPLELDVQQDVLAPSLQQQQQWNPEY